MAFLPHEIIFSNILCRLPVKTLLQSRCVSKSWCAEIDSTHFINLHRSHSIATVSNASFVIQTDTTLYSLEYDSLEKITIPKIPLYECLFTHIGNTCNGLLLVQKYDLAKWNSEPFILFNPSTRSKMLLPTSPPVNSKYANMVPVYKSIFLGYDTINDDYKVFSISQFRNTTACEVMVYSLKSNSWCVITDFDSGISFKRVSPFKAYVNGALHSVHLYYPSCIISFDVGKECFDLIPLPNLRNTIVSHLTLHDFDGCLAFSCNHFNNHTDIWVMREYGVKESWTLLLSVKTEYPHLHANPIVYSKSRTEVLLSFDHKKLVWYDLKKKSVKGVELNGLFGLPVVCVGSLVSIGDRGEINEKINQLGDEKMKGTNDQEEEGCFSLEEKFGECRL